MQPVTHDDLAKFKTELVSELTTAIGEMFVMQTEQFNERMDGLEGRMDGLEGRIGSIENKMDRLECEFRDFKSYVTIRLNDLEAKIDALQSLHGDRFENVKEDIRMLYVLVDKMERGNKAEKAFAKDTIVKHLPAIYKAVVLVARDMHIPLPAPTKITTDK